MKTKVGQIFHHYSFWEDYKHNFYDNVSGIEKDKKRLLVFEMFNSEKLTRDCMTYVIKNWKYSMEHNLTNNSINKIAYIGQCACAYYGNIPNTVTMECWSELSKEVQERSNKIAEELINKWIVKNKNIQLCLNID